MSLLDSGMTLVDLQVILAVAESASCTRAAHKLGISQPAVSRRLAMVERRLGVRLFRREGQKFIATEAGQTFCAHATEILDRVDSLENETMGVAHKPKGPVALGVPPSTGEMLLRHIIPEYRRLYPDVRIRIEQGYVGDLFEMLMNKQIDVALLNGRYSSTDVYTEKIHDYHLGIVYPRAWNDRSPLDGGPFPDSLTMEQVARLPMFLPSPNQSLRQLIDEAFQKAEQQPRIEAEINSFVLQKSMVLAGLGAMFMTTAAIRLADRDKLSFVPITDAHILYTLHVAVRQFGQPTFAARLMFDMVRAQKSVIRSFLMGEIDN
jgi:DNA-binding transcriptional LysR family regulator